MAKKKARTPPPPRKVQAPARRDTGGGPRPSFSAVPRWGWAAGAGALVVALVVIVVLVTSSSSSKAADVKSTMLAAGCTYRDVPPKPPKNKTDYHADVPSLSTSTKGLWSTFPPSAGGHYPLWAVWGFYTNPVNPRQVVHNEEHGAVVIWWGPNVSKATIAQLQGFYNQQPVGVFGTPIAGLGNKIALTAWSGDPNKYYKNGYYGMGHIAICSHFDQKAFAAFRSAYRGKGPEGIPLKPYDEPGQGPSS